MSHGETPEAMQYLNNSIFALQAFSEHATRLVEVADLACSMSSKEDGVRMVRVSAAQIENLCPQVGTKSEAFRMTMNLIFY